MVIIASGVLMVVMGVFGKVGAIFTTIPTPVIGGMFMVMFGVISAAGVSNLQVHSILANIIHAFINKNRTFSQMLFFFPLIFPQYADMNSSRNIFVFGFSMFSGLVIPNWIIKHPDAIATGAWMQLPHMIFITKCIILFFNTELISPCCVQVWLNSTRCCWSSWQPVCLLEVSLASYWTTQSQVNIYWVDVAFFISNTMLKLFEDPVCVGLSVCRYHNYCEVLCQLRISPLYLHWEQVLFYWVCHVAPPGFYSSPECSKQTLALERVVCIIHVFLSSHPMGGWQGGYSVAVCTHTARCREILNIHP